jgi:hypothetical protein
LQIALSCAANPPELVELALVPLLALVLPLLPLHPASPIPATNSTAGTLDRPIHPNKLHPPKQVETRHARRASSREAA